MQPNTKITATTPPHGGDVYHLARSLGLELADLLDFSANINPLGFPAGIQAAIRQALGEIVHYPDRRCLELRRDLAAYHGLSVEQILVGNGSTELLYLVARALAPRQALIVAPAFSEYEHALKAAQVPVTFQITTEAGNFTLSEPLDPQGAELVFLAHPASPSGVLLAPELLLEVAARLDAAGVYLLLDEAFVDFVEEASLKTQLARLPTLADPALLHQVLCHPGDAPGLPAGGPGTHPAPGRGAGALVGEHPGPGHGPGLPPGSGLSGPFPGLGPSGAGIPPGWP